MEDPQTNFDRYLERKLQDSALRARFEAADQAWDIALQLSSLRQARGLTQKQVAELLGTKQQAVARLEDPTYTGHSLNMVRKYVAALGGSLRLTIAPIESIDVYTAPRNAAPQLVHEKRGDYGTNHTATEPDESRESADHGDTDNRRPVRAAPPD